MIINHYFFLKLVMFFLFLTPSISFIPGVPNIRLEEILLILWLSLVLIFKKISVSDFIDSGSVWLVAFFLLVPISMLSGIFTGYSGEFSDLNQYVRFTKYVAACLLAWLAFKSCDTDRIKDFTSFILIVGAFLSVVVFVQYFDIGSLNVHYVHLISDNQSQGLLGLAYLVRPIGFVGNPNILGFLLAMLFIVSLAWLCHYKNFSGVFYAALFFSAIVITLSRSALVAVIVGTLFFALHRTFFSGSRVSGFLLLSLLAGLSLLAYVTLQVPYIYENFTWRFVRGLDLATDTSLRARFSNWGESYEAIEKNIIFGAGPLRRYDFQFHADNDYLWIMRSYGVAGLILLTLFFVKGILRSGYDAIPGLRISLLAASVVFMIPATVFSSLVLFPVLIIIISMLGACQSDKIKALHRKNITGFHKFER